MFKVLLQPPQSPLPTQQVYIFYWALYDNIFLWDT